MNNTSLIYYLIKLNTRSKKHFMSTQFTIDWMIWLLAYGQNNDFCNEHCKNTISLLRAHNKQSIFVPGIDDDIITAINNTDDINLDKLSTVENRWKIREEFKNVFNNRKPFPVEELAKKILCKFSTRCRHGINCQYSHHPSKYFGEPFLNDNEIQMIEKVVDLGYSIPITVRSCNSIIRYIKENFNIIAIMDRNNTMRLTSSDENKIKECCDIFMPFLTGRYLPRIENSYDIEIKLELNCFINMPRENDDPLDHYAKLYCNSTISKNELPCKGDNRKTEGCKYLLNSNICSKGNNCTYSHHPKIIFDEIIGEPSRPYWLRDDAVLWLLRYSDNTDYKYVRPRISVVNQIIKNYKQSSMYYLIKEWMEWRSKIEQ